MSDVQESAHDWRLVLYVSAAVCFTAGTSFALFAGQSVAPPLSEAAAAVTQSVELVPRPPQSADAPSDKTVDDDVDTRRTPLSQELAVSSTRRVEFSDNNHIVRRLSSPTAGTECPQPRHTTHSQVISIV